MSGLTKRICELEQQHGSLRALARVLQVDAGWLSRLRDDVDNKHTPSDALLRKLGLERVVTYQPVRRIGR